MSKRDQFKYFKTSPEIIKLAVMYYVRYPLSLRQVEDILHERGIDICHETVRYWWNKFGALLAKNLKKKAAIKPSNWRWHIDEVFVKINGETHYLWRAVDHEGTILDCYVTKKRDRKAALKVLKSSYPDTANHFNHQRHLETRDHFKNLRQISINSWKQIYA